MSKERELMDAMRSVQAESTTWRGSDRVTTDHRAWCSRGLP
jgi:hypothetical protein